MEKRKKLKLLEDFFNNKTSNSQLIMQLNKLFLLVNNNKTMIYALVDGETESIKLDNYLKLLPDTWNSLDDFFDNFLNKGKEITLSEFIARKKVLYSLEQFKINKNLKEKINWSFYFMTVLTFKDNLYRVFTWLTILYFFII